MSTVSRNVLKGNVLEYLRQVEETGEELLVTDDGRPVVKVVPIAGEGPSRTCSVTYAAASCIARTSWRRRPTRWPET